MSKSTTIRQIPLNKLVLSVRNARKTPATEADDAELYASIKHDGLKRNLLVHAVGDEFHVGGRSGPTPSGTGGGKKH